MVDKTPAFRRRRAGDTERWRARVRDASAAAASLPILPLGGSTCSLEQTAAIMAAAVGLRNGPPGFAWHEFAKFN